MRLVKADELPAKDGTTSDPFCTFKLGKQKEQKSWVISSTLQPTWNQKFEWRNVSPAPPACCLDSRIVGCRCAMRPVASGPSATHLTPQLHGRPPFLCSRTPLQTVV